MAVFKEWRLEKACGWPAADGDGVGALWLEGAPDPPPPSRVCGKAAPGDGELCADERVGGERRIALPLHGHVEVRVTADEEEMEPARVDLVHEDILDDAGDRRQAVVVGARQQRVHIGLDWLWRWAWRLYLQPVAVGVDFAPLDGDPSGGVDVVSGLDGDVRVRDVVLEEGAARSVRDDEGRYFVQPLPAREVGDGVEIEETAVGRGRSRESFDVGHPSERLRRRGRADGGAGGQRKSGEKGEPFHGVGYCTKFSQWKGRGTVPYEGRVVVRRVSC